VAEHAIRAIVLDFNGTLAQDDAVMAPLFVAGFASLGIPLTIEEYHRDFGAMPDRDVFAVAMHRAGLPFDAARRDALVKARHDGYMAAVAHRPPIDDHALAFVRAASKRVELAVASGAFRREIEHVLRSAGVSDHFKVVVSIDDVQRGKPDPEGFRYALAQLNSLTAADPPIAPEETVAVEDATDGARAARAAGMRVAAIRGVGYDEDSGCADVIVERLDVQALEQMLALPGAPG
jgi:beta-phosphoglucomutase